MSNRLSTTTLRLIQALLLLALFVLHGRHEVCQQLCEGGQSGMLTGLIGSLTPGQASSKSATGSLPGVVCRRARACGRR